MKHGRKKTSKFWVFPTVCLAATAAMFGYAIPYVNFDSAVIPMQTEAFACDDAVVPQYIIKAQKEAEEKAKKEEEAKKKAEEERRLEEEAAQKEAEEAALAAQEAASYAETESYTEYYYEPSYAAYSAPSMTSEEAAGVNLKSAGVVNADDKTWTWYSQNVLPGSGLTELNNNGRTVNDQGYVTDGDGYIAVASPWGQDEIGTVIDTPWGQGKIYDSNAGGSYDIYTNW